MKPEIRFFISNASVARVCSRESRDSGIPGNPDIFSVPKTREFCGGNPGKNLMWKSRGFERFLKFSVVSIGILADYLF